LVQLNFNSPDFIRYATERLKPDILDTHTPGYILDYTRVMNKVRQLHPQPAALHPPLGSCQEGIVACMQQEIDLLRAQASQPVTNEHNTVQSRPVQTCLTVSQLAVILRWCNKTGILTCEVTDDLFKQVARSIGINGRKQYRASSLKTEYYEMDPTAVSGAKDYIIMLLNEAKRK